MPGKKMQPITEERLLKCLPHGSGFDSDWTIVEHKKTFDCHASYHCMDEDGYYDSWVYYYAKLRKSPEISNEGTDYEFESVNFTVHFVGQFSQNRARSSQYFYLRDQIEDTIAYALDEEFCHEK